MGLTCHIYQRAKKYKIKLDIGLDYSELDATRKRNKSGSITGIIHLDMHSYIKNIFGRSMNLDSLSLNSVSEELLGEKKVDADLNDLSKAWDKEPEKLDLYCEYNLQDSRLVFNLCQKLLTSLNVLVKMIGINMYDISRLGVSQLIEWYLIRRTSEFNDIIPNKPKYDEIRKRMAHTFRGAFVFEPTPGLFKKIVIFDYRSLYPSIISAHNISPETLDCECCRDEQTEKKKDEIIEGHWFCKKKKGFLPSIINDLITRRIRIKKMINSGEGNPLLKAKQQNFKLLANSFYGYLGFYGARWYSLESAEAVTAYGRYYINDVIEKAETKGFKVVYGDTDSIFLLLEDKDIDEAKKFVDEMNHELPEQMELEYEGFYPSAIFVKAKASETGAKKRYALLKDDGKIIIKGFETVRRNWSIIGKETQKDVLDILLKKHDPEEAKKHIMKIIDNLRQQKIEIDKVTITTQIQKKSYLIYFSHFKY